MEVRVDVKVDGEDETQLRRSAAREGDRKETKRMRAPQSRHNLTWFHVSCRRVEIGSEKSIKKELQMVHEMVHRPEKSEDTTEWISFFLARGGMKGDL